MERAGQTAMTALARRASVEGEGAKESGMEGIPGLTNLEGAVVEYGKTVLIRQTLTDGRVIEIAMPGADLGRMVSFLIELARDAGERGVDFGVQTINSAPIKVASMSVARGRTEHDGLIALPVGPMTLTFSLPLELLLDQLEMLRGMTANGRLGKKH